VTFHHVADLATGRSDRGRLNNKAHDAGVRLDLGLEVRTRKPTGDLPIVKHPTVGLIDMGNHITQRQTGLTSMSRSDAQWT
jgi:hypothetical protein